MSLNAFDILLFQFEHSHSLVDRKMKNTYKCYRSNWIFHFHFDAQSSLKSLLSISFFFSSFPLSVRLNFHRLLYSIYHCSKTTLHWRLLPFAVCSGVFRFYLNRKFWQTLFCQTTNHLKMTLFFVFLRSNRTSAKKITVSFHRIWRTLTFGLSNKVENIKRTREKKMTLTKCDWLENCNEYE